MSNTDFENLDLACAKLGQCLVKNSTKDSAKDLAAYITGALAVLEEQGLYALFLYLKSHPKGDMGLPKKIYDFLQKNPRNTPLLSPNDDILIAIQHLSQDCDKLILARDLVHQAFVYARYHAKMRQKDGEHS